MPFNWPNKVSSSACTLAHLVDQGGFEEEPGKLIQQRLGIECLSLYCLFINCLKVFTLPGLAAVHKGSGVKLEALGAIWAGVRDARRGLVGKVRCNFDQSLGQPCIAQLRAGKSSIALLSMLGIALKGPTPYDIRRSLPATTPEQTAGFHASAYCAA